MSWKDSYETRIAYVDNYIKDKIINQGIKDFNTYLNNAPNKETIITNGKTYECVIQDVAFNDGDKDNKILLISLESPIITGINFKWGNEDWIIVGMEKSTIPTHKTFKITQCNNTLKFYKNKTLYTLPCIMQSGSGNYIDAEENKFLISPNSRYICIVPDLGYITKSDMNIRFIMNGSAYKIEGIDNVSRTGLIVLELNDDEITPDDNLELSIANYYSNQQSPSPSTEGWTVSLTPSDTTLTIGRTLELIAHAYYDGVEDLTKYYLFTVTNVDGTSNEYVTVDDRDNFCILTAIKNFDNAGKYINVHVELLGQSNIYYDRRIKLTASI